MKEEKMNFGPQPIGPAQVAEAAALLQKYKAGKAALDRRLIDNELWYRMGHWKQYKNRMMEEKPQPASGWLFNCIASKHADAMDNYPEPNVLPRSADDEMTAKTLSSVLPVVLEQADYEQVYSDTWWRKLKQGTGVKGIFWDPEARGGVGEITVRPMNLLMLYWEPGVEDIQDSPDFFSLSLENTKQLERRWPQLAGHGGATIDVGRYIHDDSIDTSDKSVVVDWYYKRPDENGRMLLHYCKFCNGVPLYASENDPDLAARGYYDHGKYPFVFDPLFREEDSPAGFGYVDILKDCQTSIDRMNQAMDENVLLASKQRYFLSDTAGVNEEELCDLSRDIILVSGQEQYDQDLYYRELEEYYNQLDRKGDAYNQAYAQDYAEYTDYLTQLDDLRDYYVQQEQYNATLKQQRFNNVMTVLGLIGDGIQLALSGTTGLGSLANGLLQTGYNMYANNRDYEAERADTAWSQQMQELLRQDSLNQQAYDNTTAAQEYQDALAQQAFDNDVTSQKLAIAQAEWALKQAQAQSKAANASTRATSTAQTTATTANSGNTAAAAAGANNSVLSYTVARLKAMGKTNQQITSQLAGEGYSQDDIAKILAQLNS